LRHGGQLLKPAMHDDTSNVINTTDDGIMAADANETWSKMAFGDARLIFAIVPPPIIVTGVVVTQAGTTHTAPTTRTTTRRQRRHCSVASS